MAFSQFPAPAAGGAEEAAFAATIPALQTTFEQVQDIPSGIYSIDVSPVTTQAQLVFVDATSILATVTTTLGLVAVQLNSPATKVYITTLAGGTVDAIVTMTKTAAILTPDDIGNGTLDTITTTGAYNETGLLSVLAFGGGAAGAKGGIGSGSSGGAGGASGGIVLGFVYNNGATTVTVGAKGTAAISNNTNITAPTESSFGNLLTSATSGLFYVSGAGNGGPSTYQAGNVGTASRTFTSFNTTSTTGGGGGGNAGAMSGGALAGGGSGIGTGGSGAPGGGGSQNTCNPTTAGTAGTGKASGGGGGATTGNGLPDAAGRFGGDGADGVVYILRGF